MNKLSVGQKIIGGFLFVVGLVVLMSLFTYFKIDDINDSYRKLIEKNLTKIDLAQCMATDLANEAVVMRRFNFTGDREDLNVFNEYKKTTDERIVALEGSIQTEKGKNILAKIKKEKLEYEEIAEASFKARTLNDMDNVALYMQRAGTAYKACLADTNALVELVKLRIQTDQQEQDDAADHIQLILFLVNILVAVIAIFIGFFVSRKIVLPIKEITITANMLAKGDLTQKDIIVNSTDEIGTVANTFNLMKNQLQQLIRQIGTTTQQVAASSEELTASAEQSAQATQSVAQTVGYVAEGTERQTTAVGKTTTVVKEMLDSIQQVADNANTVSEAADKTTISAQRGRTVVDSARQQMMIIEDAVGDSAKDVGKLGERSKEIGQIVDTISGIAGQTNLLALNAAIEAARAGEQGRGFSVVAEEVRKLAEQSQDAAKQISTLIYEIQLETENAVLAMNKGASEVNSGTVAVESAGEVFEEIVSLVAKVSSQVREISAAIQQVASGSQHISDSVHDIDVICQATSGQAQTVSSATEEQAATMEEIANASHSLAEMAGELQNAVSRFKV